MEFEFKTGRTVFPVGDYDLAATLTSGQAFRWQRSNGGWEGVVGSHWVRLSSQDSAIGAETLGSAGDWHWLADYLQVHVDLEAVVATFPDDAPMQAARQACRGLRLLRQDPWECLASFILSSTKQIAQIRQIVARLCERWGSPVPMPPGRAPAYAFPSAEALASCTEAELRSCRMGFRAPFLRETAQVISSGELNPRELAGLSVDAARERLTALPGVGRKIADCVLLFAYGFETAFPVDVWVMRALRQLYFPDQQISASQVHQFATTHFGPHAGYAQQYLFHYMRQRFPRTRHAR